MKVSFFGYQIGFKGRREDKNSVSQLKNNNNYSLTEPNQRKINQAIDNLSKNSGEENIDFLLDVADNLKYGTNIDTGKTPKNDWKSKLKTAVETSLNHSNPILKEKYQPKIEKIFNEPKELTEEEKSIIKYKNAILAKADIESLKENKDENVRSLERNMNYFITSSEVPIAQKLYVLKRLDYFMGPEYEINPQLSDKKTQVLAEMMNDLALNTKESKIPNIKAINQKSHGMCAAISIVRKSLAYEDKPNYVDAILSELDSSDSIMVYDRFNLGSGKRIPVKKTYVDFDYAQAKGYRIVDAAATYWMHIADMYGLNNESMTDYNAFDKINFDALQDAHFHRTFAKEDLRNKHLYYQALSKAQDDIASYKSSVLKSKIQDKESYLGQTKNLELIQVYNNLIRTELKGLLPSSNSDKINSLYRDLGKLPQATSGKIDKAEVGLKQYSFLPNEEEKQKIKKIKQYLIDKTHVADDEKLNKSAKSILGALEDINELSQLIKPQSSIVKKFAQARRAYETEAIYRASVITGLNEKDVLIDNMIKYNVPDRETSISDSLGQMIQDVEKTDNIKLVAFLAEQFQIPTPKDEKEFRNSLKDIKEEVVEALNVVKVNFDDNMTNLLDELYYRLGLDSRKEVLQAELAEMKEEIASGDKVEQSRLAELLHIENSKKATITALEKFEKQLASSNYNEKTYIDIFNKIGYKNQLNVFVERYKTVLEMASNPESADYNENVEILKALNSLPENADSEDLLNLFKEIGGVYNGISEATELAASLIGAYSEFLAESGVVNPLTIDSRLLVLRKMENSGELVRRDVMQKLQERITKVDKIRSTDEFASRQGKISQPELYKLSPSEQDAIKLINKKLDKMYADVTRRLTNQLREIKPYLEELNRITGTNQGHYWLSSEGHSGLYSQQQVKILEQITDRPYYSEENIGTAADIIMNSAHSGISSTSVFHDKAGWHAQYVADIKKVGPEQKYAIFHDNTWGPSEHENTWVDSEGITRTDYSDHRGGELGYITDEDWRNGNYMENLMKKKGHIVPEVIENKNYKKLNPTNSEGYDFPLMDSIIINGENPELKSIAGGIKDSIYIPEVHWVDNFAKTISKMTKEQMEVLDVGEEHVRAVYQKRYDAIMKRIEKTPFNNGINTKADYDRLPDNDSMKIEFEKVSTKQSYPNFYMMRELAQAKTIDEIQEIRDKLKSNAKKDFYYAFGKSQDILLYYAFEHSREVSKEFLDILNKHNVKFEYEDIPDIFKNTAVYYKDEESKYTGSIKDTINFVVEKVLRQYDQKISPTPESKAAREEFKEYLTKKLNDVMYFNSEDLKSEKFRAQAIRKWVDRKFDPADDAEFVQIYRKLQDMTTEEFDKYTNDLTDEDLGIKPITGYDVLMNVKNINHKSERDLRNLIFYEELQRVFNMSTTRPSYKYQKTQKSLRGAIYKNRTLDDLYRTFVYSLNSLEYEKLFNKYKDINYKNYKAFPSYPRIDLIEERRLDKVLFDLENKIKETTTNIALRKSCENSIVVLKKLRDYVNDIPADRPLTKEEYEVVNRMVGELLTSNYNDKELERALNAAYDMLSFDKTVQAGKYRDGINVMLKEFQTYDTINAETPFREQNKDELKEMREYISGTLLYHIPEKFRSLLIAEFNTWINEECKKRDDNLADRLTEFEVRKKLLDYSNGSNSRLNVEKFTAIITALNEIKTKRNQGAYNSSVDKGNEHLNTKINEYVHNFVADENQEDAEKILKFLIKNTVLKAQKLGTSVQDNYEKINSMSDKYVHDFVSPENQNKAKRELKVLVKNAISNSQHEHVTTELEKDYEKVTKMADAYVSNFISAENQNKAKRMLQVWIDTETGKAKKSGYNAKKANQAKEKFEKDFKKYHYLEHPLETFKAFIDSSVKDSKTADLKEYFKTIFSNHLRYSMLIDIQELLMEAVDNGNAAEVRNYFKDYYVYPYDDVLPQKMDSGESISYMVKNLILNNNNETAKMFVEKLGLADTLIDFETKEFDDLQLDKEVESILSIVNTTYKNMDVVHSEVEELCKVINNSDSFEKLIDKAKANIISKTKDNERQEEIKKYLEMLDAAKKRMQDAPDIKRSLVVSQYIYVMEKDILEQTNLEIRKIQEYMNEALSLYGFIAQLSLPVDSELSKKQEALTKKYIELARNYQQSMLGIKDLFSKFRFASSIE